MIKKLAKVLVIAGSDSGAGAGIQADIKSISANGVYAATAITAITAQNTTGVQAIHNIPPAIITAQIDSVMSDIGADVIKTGMLSSAEIISAVAEAIAKYNIPLVLDPVMVAKGGAKLLQNSAVDELKNLISKAYLITPNIPEAEILSGLKIKNVNDMQASAEKILQIYNCNAVLLKGGHLGSQELTDILLERAGDLYFFTTNKINTANTHGTGCTYASAIAANLAKGEPLKNAVAISHEYLQGAIRNATAIGSGHSPVAHFWNI